jgi:putative FmdB family regulatory protein
MPRYDFQCESCEEVFEVKRSFSDTGPVACKACGSQSTHQVFSLLSTFARSGRKDSPLDDMPHAEEYRKQADAVIHHTLKRMGKI